MGHAMVLPYQTQLTALLKQKRMISFLRQKATIFGGHGEGFTNALEILAANWGLYNKVTGFDSEGYAILSETEADLNVVFGAIQNQARLGVRAGASIRMNDPAYNMSYPAAQDLWYNLTGYRGDSFLSRDWGGNTYNNANYFPAALFVMGAEKKYQAEVPTFTYKDFFQLSVVNQLQPANIASFEASIAAFYKNPTATAAAAMVSGVSFPDGKIPLQRYPTFQSDEDSDMDLL